jgi:hypothetical protein
VIAASTVSPITHTSTLPPEWQLLLTACSRVSAEEKKTRIDAIFQRQLDWPALLALAERHGVQPLLHQAVALFKSIPVDVSRTLNQNYESNLHKSLLLSRELIRILDHLASLRIDAMPYKGLAVAEALYGDIALRQSGDIDLLIHREDFPRVLHAALELGYTAHTTFSPAHENSHLQSGYECSFDGAAGPNLLEVQWAIQPKFYAIDFDMPALFTRATTLNVAGVSMKSLRTEDMLLVLAAHAAKHVWGRLIWLSDLARIFNLPNLDWNNIISEARKLGIVRILQVSAFLSQNLLASKIPAPLISTDSAIFQLAGEIQSHITGESTYNVESLAYFRLMMRLRERPADRRRFLRRLVLTPGPGEWNAIRLPHPLFPLYRVVRLFRLAARFIRR